jgi:hypothetical protein
MVAYSSKNEQTPMGMGNYAINQYTPEQTSVFANEFNHLGKGSYLERLANGDQELYNEMEAPQFQKYNAQQGQLASYFSGMGMGGRKSSGFQNAANQSSMDFAQELQKNRADMRNNAIKNLMGLSDQVLNQRPQERGLTQNPEDSNNHKKFAGTAIGGIAGLMFGQPAQGAQLGYQWGST